METKGNDLTLTLKQKKGAKGTVKEAKALLDAKTLAPKQERMPVKTREAYVQRTPPGTVDFSRRAIASMAALDLVSHLTRRLVPFA